MILQWLSISVGHTSTDVECHILSIYLLVGTEVNYNRSSRTVNRLDRTAYRYNCILKIVRSSNGVSLIPSEVRDVSENALLVSRKLKLDIEISNDLILAVLNYVIFNNRACAIKVCNLNTLLSEARLFLVDSKNNSSAFINTLTIISTTVEDSSIGSNILTIFPVDNDRFNNSLSFGLCNMEIST